MEKDSSIVPMNKETGANVPVNARAAGIKKYPLSPMERDMYLEQKFDPECISYNLNFGFIVEGADAKAICAAVRSVSRSHEALHSYYGEEDGVPCRILTEEVPEVSDGATLSRAAFEEKLADPGTPFVLENGIPARVSLHPILEGGFGLHLQIHHIAFDGNCRKLFTNELLALLKGDALPANAPDIYGVYAAAQAGASSGAGDKDAKAFAFFDKMFEGGVPVNDLPLKGVRPNVALISDTLLESVLDRDTVAGMKEKADMYGVTVFELMLSVYAAILGQYCSSEDVVVNVPVNTRDAFSADMIGMFVNSVPVRIRPKNEDSLSGYFKEVSETVRKATRSFGVPFETLTERYCPERDASREPLFDMGINYQYVPETCREGGFACTPVVRGPQHLKRDINLSVYRNRTTMKLFLGFSAEMFEKEIMDNFLDQFQYALKRIAEGTASLVKDLKQLPERQIKKLNSFNPAQFPEQDGEETIVSLFREAARKYPDTVALVFNNKRYTYRQLDEITDILSVFIAETVGEQEEQSVVSILIPRNEYMAILPLAAQKAGCCFQPLDMNYPKERLNFMAKDANASLVFADPSLADILSDYSGRIILTTEIEKIISEGRKAPMPAPAKSGDAFILLYTSGSTGVPKGVILEQRNLVAYCLWYREYYHHAPGSGLACYASFGFDAHMSEMYGALANGCTCHIIPEEIRLDLIALNRYFEENRIVGTLLTTAVGVQFALNIESSSLKALTTGGEKLVSLEPPKEYQLINGYGPTETTIIATTKKVNNKEENIPIGKPLSTVRCYIVDKNLDRLPIGVPGELIIAGPQVGRGYLNRPEKTAEVFIRDPFSADDSGYLSRAYRTGDIVRWRTDGDIEYIGRRDSQVKIHGFRIELKEVEAVIHEFSGIKDVTVQVIDGESGEKFIAAYVVSDTEVNKEALKQFIAGKKPPYMVPAAVVQLEKIPLNANQKVDRKALPVPEPDAGEEAVDEIASDIPMNVLETELKELAAQVLGTENIGLTDRLSRLGLTSISAIRLATLVYKKYGVAVKAVELVSGGTLRTMEDAVLEAWIGEKKAPEKKTAQEKTEQPKQPGNRPAFFPLSFTQRGVYAECMASPDATIYNIPFCIGFPESVKAEELKEALQKVIQAHPSFSIRFTADENNETVQYFSPEGIPDIPVKEMSSEAFAGYPASFVRPFALTDAPMARFEIVCADRLYLLADTHHLISDGSSADIFFRQLCACLDGEDPEKEEYTYYDHAANEVITEETEKFFEERMADCEEATRLIPDIFTEGLPHSEGSVAVKTDLKSVSVFAAENGLTPAAVYLAAEYIACSRYTCEDSAAITTISNGRSDLRLHNTLGMFVNTLPLTEKIDNAESTLSFLRRVAENYAATIEHEKYPFAKVAQKFDFHASLSYTYQVGVIDEYRTRGEALSVKTLELDTAKLPCSVYIMGSAEKGASIQIRYDTALYSESMMRSFAESVENALHGLMNEKTLADISLTAEERWKVLDSYNRTFDLDYDHSDTAVSLFRKQAVLHSDKIAAVYKDKEYTFSELDSLSDRLAEIIYTELSGMTGLSSLAEQVVPILSTRSENAFILPLAVLKTGSAYAPLDPDYPSERLNFMVKDAGAKLLLCERGLEERVNEFDGKLLFMDELYGNLENGYSVKVPADRIPAPKPQDLLIMLYTSGTTGVPKGVQLIHENLVCFTHGSALDGLYTEESKTATYASFGFDVNMADTFCTMLNGGTVYLIPEEARMDMSALGAYFDEAGITDVLLTTQVGVQFINSFPKLKTLRMLTVGGEKLPAINVDKLSYTVYNGYGPTENCAGVSIFPVRTWEANIPIGKPFPTINAFVLDKTGHRLPAGAAGEYCLTGPQVGRGYLNRPDKTAEAFENCPFNSFRMYHSGDIVRYRQNGDVEFVGRKDGQVKIRGFRVELKEIEAVIREFEGIGDVTVQAYDYESGGKYLAAFVVSDKKIDSRELSEFIKSQKPAYMVPAVIQQIGEIPLTVNRKVDKKALPKPEVQKGEYMAPQTKAEEDFCRIFGEILGVEKVGAEDDFFELGGSSISAMKVVLAAGKAGYGIVYQDVFDSSTPRLLAALNETDVSAVSVSENTPSSAVGGSCYGPNTTEIGRDGYDYTRINAMLRENTLDAFRNGETQEVGDVLLTGPTGFLGSHVLYELIQSSDRRIFCLSRSKNGASGEARLKDTLRLYFGTDFGELFGSRLFVIEGDATDTDSLKDFAPKEEVTVINCAANVAHFAKDDSIWRTNVNSVEKLIAWCLAHKMRLVHVSTGSVSGASENGVPGDGFKLDEHVLFAGQLVEDNQYIHSKFMAERRIYEAILEKGLRAKVMRVCNLAPRFSDGMAQINYATNNFLCSMRAFRALGRISYEMMNKTAELSPIDYVARAVVTLARTPDACTCFMLANEYRPKMGHVILQLSPSKEKIRLVEPEEFQGTLRKALEDPDNAELMRPLLAYASSKKEGNVHSYGFDVMNTEQTLQILYRLGFSWPVTDGAYVERFASRLEQLGFFK